MKRLLILAVGAGLVLGVAGCGGGDGDDELVGTWRATSYNGQPVPAPYSAVVTLNADGTATAVYNAGSGTETAQGTWTAENGLLTLNAQGQTRTGAYSINDDTITLVNEEGTATFARQ